MGSAFDIKGQFLNYRSHTENPQFDLTPYTALFDQLDQYQSISTLCHNDLVAGNVCFQGEHCYIIDYEYACDNDPYFDLLSFITENDIQDECLRNVFFEAYFKGPVTNKQLQKIRYYEKLLNLYWCQWAMMRASQHDDPIYSEIAALKFQRLKEKHGELN